VREFRGDWEDEKRRRMDEENEKRNGEYGRGKKGRENSE
jgi:hypothetical protein